MISHYLPAFTRTLGVRQQAACGQYIFPAQHSTTPNCEPCLDYLTAEAATDAAMGQLVSEKNDPALLVKPREFDPTRGYRLVKGGR